MKKTISILLLVLFALSFGACQEKDKEDTNTSIEHGKTENGAYTNTFADITFTAPNGWLFAADAELLATTEHTGQKLDSGILNSIFEEVGLAFDMTCYSPVSENYIGVVFANTKHEQFEGYSVDRLLTEMLEQTGLDTEAGVTKEDVTLGSNTYLRLCATSKTPSSKTGYATLYGRKTGSAITVIVTACTDDFTVSQAEACFS